MGSCSSSSRSLRRQRGDADAPSFELKRSSTDTELEFECMFPGASSAEDLTLDVSSKTLRVTPSASFSVRIGELSGYRDTSHVIEVQLPFEVDPSSVRARFKRGQGRLVVRLTRV